MEPNIYTDIAVSIGALIFFAAVVYIPQLIANQLAKKKIFITAPQEASAESVVVGERLHHMVMAMTGGEFICEYHNWEALWTELREKENMERIQHFLPPLSTTPEDIDKWEIVGTPTRPMPRRGLGDRIKDLAFPYGGYRYVGIPPSYKIHEYSFAWVGVATPDDEGKKEFKVHQEEHMKHIYLREVVYAMTLRNLELKAAGDAKGVFQADIVLVARVVIRNPARALHKVHRWLDATWKIIISEFRPEAMAHTYEELLALSEQGGQTPEQGKDLSKDLHWIHDVAIRDGYGVEIKGLRMYSVDPAESQLKLREAAVEGEVQRLKGEGVRQAARAKADALRTFDDVAKTVSPNTLVLNGQDTLRETGSNVFVQAGTGFPVLVSAPSNTPATNNQPTGA